ncbi:MAG: DUF2063 domain-containing protein [Deltaproteobacteria bacterium]|nr:DUF2063 domain-containing protein [Deltaproteobacteria bacterium]
MLRELQRRFVRDMLAGESWVHPYRENLLCGHAEALESLYPVCRRLVGDEFFRAAARRFALGHPASSPDLNDYGAELADFFAGFEPARALPYLPDVARLERALHRALLAPVPPRVDLAALAQVPEARRGQVRFALAPGVALLESRYPADRIWLTNQPGYTGEDRVDLSEGGVRLAVWFTPDGEPALERLVPAELQLLAGFERGLTLDDACASWPGTSQELAGFLARAVQRGWIGSARVG